MRRRMDKIFILLDGVRIAISDISACALHFETGLGKYKFHYELKHPTGMNRNTAYSYISMQEGQRLEKFLATLTFDPRLQES
jgi:hypothetical protein